MRNLAEDTRSIQKDAASSKKVRFGLVWFGF
jgi:hypothetical protein